MNPTAASAKETALRCSILIPLLDQVHGERQPRVASAPEQLHYQIAV